MRTPTALPALQDAIPPQTNRMLVVAPAGDAPETQVALADGSYESDGERVFWHGSPTEPVLRLAADQPVTTHPLRRPAESALSAAAPGLRALRLAVQQSRAEERSGAPTPFGTPLSRALEAHTDPDLALAEAMLLWKQGGLLATYGEISRCLDRLASAWAAGTGSVLAEHRATHVAAQVVSRLAATTSAPHRRRTVVLAVLPGDAHTLALSALAHLVSDAGWRAETVDALPLPELTALAALPETDAVLISVHTPASPDLVRDTVAALHGAAPDLLVAIGGPGLPARATGLGADLVGTDVTELLSRLDSRSTGLTDRESQVLTLVADGLTNAEISQRLGVAPATVKSHLDRILAKTDSEHRAGAVAVALRQGWIT